MGLQTGDAACTTGMSHRIYAAIIGGTNTGFSGSMTTAQSDSIKALAYGIAVGVVGEIQSSAAVNVTAPANAFGDAIPGAPVILSGGVT